MSEQEQTQEPSLEEILTSIRKKIATGEEVPLTDAAALGNDGAGSGLSTQIAAADSVDGRAAEHNPGSPASIDIAAMGARDTAAKKEVYPGRLSDMLGRINDDDLGASQTAGVGGDDDLADILDQPLPTSSSVSESGTATDAAADPADVSFAQALGLATTNDATESASNTTAAAATSEPLELKALEDDGSLDGSASGVGSLESIELSQISADATDDVPRVMASLTSGFKIADGANADSQSVTTIEVKPANLDKPGEQAAVVVTSTPEPADATVPSGAASSGATATGAAPTDTSAPIAAATAPAAIAGIETAAVDSVHNGAAPAPKSLEDVVEAMLRPMLHKWLEENMPRIVENALRIEVSEGSKDERA